MGGHLLVFCLPASCLLGGKSYGAALMKISGHIPLEKPEGLSLLVPGGNQIPPVRSSFLAICILSQGYKGWVEGPVS